MKNVLKLFLFIGVYIFFASCKDGNNLNAPKAEERIIQIVYTENPVPEKVAKDGENLFKNLVPASASDYQSWLDGFIRKGGRVTHYYDYGFPLGDKNITPFNYPSWTIAIADFKMIPLYGSHAVQIIVPRGIKYLGGDIGHCSLYFMDDFKNMGDWVPSYGNVKPKASEKLTIKVNVPNGFSVQVECDGPAEVTINKK